MDPSQAPAARAADADRDRDLRALVQHIPAPLIRYDRGCRRIFVNDAFCRLSGIPREQALGDEPCDNPFIRGHVEQYRRWLLDVMANGQPDEIEIAGQDADGRELVHRWHGVPEPGPDGQAQSVLVLGRDITAQLQTERERHARELLFRSLVENSPDLVTRFDTELRRIYMNPVTANMMAAALSASALGHSPTEGSFLCDPAGYERLLRGVFASGTEASWQTTYFAADGSRRALLLRAMPEFDLEGRIVTVLATGRDVHDLVEERARAEQMAMTDSLTGLANRSMLTRELRQLQEARRAYGLAILDLDHFKDVNDTLGHRSGDELLVELARRLKCLVGASGLAARLGGDEFALLFPDRADCASLKALAARVQQALHQPVVLHTRTLRPSVSIGIAASPAGASAESESDALARADLALYDAKHAGRGTHRFWRPELSERLSERTALEADLAGAAARGELRLFVQPIVRLEDGTPVGAEALLRWQHPRRGLLMPDTFIPVAETGGLMPELSAWVIDQACAAAARWNRGRCKPLRLCINLSVRDFASEGLAARVEQALRRHRCRGEWIGVEITESLLLDSAAGGEAELQALRELGIAAAIDDFGTGYSALAYLQRLRIDRLKIDRSFVRGVDSDERQLALVRACIALGQALGLELVAEGVETEAQAQALRRLGCEAAQGWLYAKAMPLEAFEAWQERFGSPAASKPAAGALSQPR
jgi:diguanylate cyclase (GGDEF)-like protein/PAS domain S-box-containing protein